MGTSTVLTSVFNSGSLADEAAEGDLGPYPSKWGLPLVKPNTEHPQEQSGSWYMCAADKKCSLLDAIQGHEPACLCLAKRMVSVSPSTWALSQLTGLSGGQPLAAAPRADP